MPQPAATSGNSSQKKKRGRKTFYRKALCDVVRALARRESGITYEQLAAALGVNRDTIIEWVKKYPEFSDATKETKTTADAQVENALFRRAKGYDYDEKEGHLNEDGEFVPKKIVKKHLVPDTQAASLWLRNRRPDLWRDTQRIEHGLDKKSWKDLLEELAGNTETGNPGTP